MYHNIPVLLTQDFVFCTYSIYCLCSLYSLPEQHFIQNVLACFAFRIFKQVVCLMSLTELDLLPFFTTLLFCLWEIQYGIIGGVAVSGVMLLYNIARPKLKVVERNVK